MVFFVISPSGLEQVSELGEKGLKVATIYGQIGGLFSLIIGVIMLSCRDLEFGSAKRVLTGTGICLVIFNVVMIRNYFQNFR